MCIWIACNLPVSVKAEVFRFLDVETGLKNGTRPSAIGFGITKSLQLGEQLYIALVIVRPNGFEQNRESSVASGFPTETLLAYDIEISEASNVNSHGKWLAELGLTTRSDAIVYEHLLDHEVDKAGLLPTFFLSGKDAPFNIMHGSCRKLHGKGQD